MKIFLSYSHRDSQSVRFISNNLSADGHEVWIDVNGIPGGSNWVQEIGNAIKNSDWVVVLLSPDSSDSAWVNQEILLADALKIPIIPVMIRQTELPTVLGRAQYIDLTQNYEKGIEELRAILRSKAKTRDEYQLALTQSERKQEEEKVQAQIGNQRVFIAYSRKQRPLAKELSEFLFKQGKSNFYDAKIRVGAIWRQKIQKALDDATHLILIWTPDSRDSNEVDKEVSYALAEGKVIIPVLSKEIPKLPYHLHGLQYVVFDKDLKNVYDDILSALEQFSDDDLWTDPNP